MTDSDDSFLAAVAVRHGLSPGAVRALADALARGAGGAQWSHPDLGGMGQWTRGGMLQIGDMFNEALKARIGAALAELSAAPRRDGPPRPGASPRAGEPWWPADLGVPSAAGGQNGTDYACFPDRHRLALRRQGGAPVLYDTGSRRVTGVAQGGSWSLTLTGPDGPVDLRDLTPVQP